MSAMRSVAVTGWLVISVFTNSCLSAAVKDVPFTNRLGSAPPIRIGIRIGVPSVRIGANGGVRMEIGDDGGTLRSRPVELRAAQNGIRIESQGVVVRNRVRFSAIRRGEYVTVNGTAYRGWIEVLAVDGALNVVNVADIEEYLLSVVGSEIWSRSEEDLAALQAQAVAARTYALRTAGRFQNAGFDVRADVLDQAYRGVLAENGVAARAVRSTRGQVIVYNDELITAFYHSTCGSRTASPEEAFRTVRPQPYLRPVSDERPGKGYYNDLSPHFRWTVEWSGRDFARIVRETLPTVVGVDRDMIGELRDVTIHRTGPSGRVVELRIVTTRGTIPVFGPDIRSVLRTPENEALRSTSFTLEVMRRGDTVSRVIMRGSGLGHGVGLCQWGAVGRARSGQDYRTIVETYYQGASIERWY